MLKLTFYYVKFGVAIETNVFGQLLEFIYGQDVQRRQLTTLSAKCVLLSFSYHDVVIISQAN